MFTSRASLLTLALGCALAILSKSGTLGRLRKINKDWRRLIGETFLKVGAVNFGESERIDNWAKGREVRKCRIFGGFRRISLIQKKGKLSPQIFLSLWFLLEKRESSGGALSLFLGIVHVDSDFLVSYSKKPKSGGNWRGGKLFEEYYFRN